MENGVLPGTVNVLAATPHGIVAAGHVSGTPAIWLSDDGSAFAEAVLPSVESDRWVSIVSIASVGNTVIAVGHEEADVGSDDWRYFPVFLVSDDGLRWREVALGDVVGGIGGWLGGVAERDGLVVVVGSDHTAAIDSGNGFVLRFEIEGEAGVSPDPGG
jgi:hypothetical protein